jgi:hypothetical protein
MRSAIGALVFAIAVPAHEKVSFTGKHINKEVYHDRRKETGNKRDGLADQDGKIQ